MKKIILKSISFMSSSEIYNAGINWPQFNYEKGLDAIIQKDKDGKWIYYAGRDWKQFNYEKGLDALIEKDEDGYLIYLAGIKWPQFDYEKGLDALKKFPRFYELALEKWPKGIKETQKAIDEIKKKAIKFPGKSLKLESSINALKELLEMPPHYETEGYKIMLTQDLNEKNLIPFINRFKGRVLSYGKMNEMKTDFDKELIFKTLRDNKLKIDDKFFYVIYENVL